MATALHEHQLQEPSQLQSLRTDLQAFSEEFADGFLLSTRGKTAATLVDIEHLAKLIDHLQVLAVSAVVGHDIAALGERDSQQSTPSQDWNVEASAPERTVQPLSVHRNTAEYLRAKLGISRSEANRRLRLAANIMPPGSGPGVLAEPKLAVLAAAFRAGSLSMRASTVICDAVERVRPVADHNQLDAMERHLTTQAVESDEDTLRVLARRWENTLDQDGQEPTDKVLEARQGVFLHGRRNGLHFLEIGATDEQFEHLSTVMNTAANPRVVAEAEKGVGADTLEPQPTRAQNLLIGLVSACRIALAGDGLPASGGHRPQVMVTINYRDLQADLSNAGHAVFAHQLSNRSIRKLACDADIIPVILGGEGQILDLGRAKRLFPAYLRRALVARDKGCAFPDCTVPATWCEAHHIIPWAAGGTTSLRDGVLVCSRHHHVLHDEEWTVESIHGVPWFRPPKYLDPNRTPRRNSYWRVEELVQQQL
ncbi:MAG: DUF222 domain-containing protein [Actinomycetes bacterium]